MALAALVAAVLACAACLGQEPEPGPTPTLSLAPGLYCLDRPGGAGDFDSLRRALDACERHPELKFFVEHSPLVVRYWTAFPQDRERIRKLVAAGRLEPALGPVLGPDAPAPGPETATRRLVYDIGFLRRVMGVGAVAALGGPGPGSGLLWNRLNSAPGLLAALGLPGAEPDRAGSFILAAPDGAGLLVHPAAGPDPCGIRLGHDIDSNVERIAAAFLELRPPALEVLVPVTFEPGAEALGLAQTAAGLEAALPGVRVLVRTPSEFSAAVGAALDLEGGPVPHAAWRRGRDRHDCEAAAQDYNPAHRHIEFRLRAAEIWSSIANILGAQYPERALDKSWRQLLFAGRGSIRAGLDPDPALIEAHNALREAWELALEADENSRIFIASLLETSKFTNPLVVFNSLAWKRSEAVSAALALPPGARSIRVRDLDGGELPFRVLSKVEDGAGNLLAARIMFMAEDVPALGLRTFDVLAAPAGALPVEPQPVPMRSEFTVETVHYRLTVDPRRGGAITGLHDKELDRGLVTPGAAANDIVVRDLCPAHGDRPAEPGFQASDLPAVVTLEEDPVMIRIMVRGPLLDAERETEIRLYRHVKRIEFSTRVSGPLAPGSVVEARFPVDLPGGRAVVETPAGAEAVPFPAAADLAAHTWLDFTPPMIAYLRGAGNEPIPVRALAAVEIAHPDGDEYVEQANKLVRALARAGVPAAAAPDREEHFRVEYPDLRIVLGPGAAPPAAESDAESDWSGPVWLELDAVPPTLAVVDDAGFEALLEEILQRRRITAYRPGPEPFEARARAPVEAGFVLMNRGASRHQVFPDGTVVMPLMRTGTAGDRRFEWSITTHGGSWRRGAPQRSGWEYNAPLAVVAVPPTQGFLPPVIGFVRLEPEGPALTAMKAAGNPLAEMTAPETAASARAGITMRLADHSGLGATAKVHFFRSLDRVFEADMLERPREETAVAEKAFFVQLEPFETAAMLLRSPAMSDPRERITVGREREAADAVFAPYWRHAAGAAPLGAMPLGLGFDRDRIEIEYAGESARVTLRVASNYALRHAIGDVRIAAPEGWSVFPESAPYSLEPGGYAFRELDLVAPTQGLVSGDFFLTARTFDASGQVIEDAVLLKVRRRVADLAGEWRFAAGDDHSRARPGLDRSEWLAVRLPGPWPDPNGGPGWLARDFEASESWRGESVAFRFPAGLEGEAMVFLNGFLIGIAAPGPGLQEFEAPAELVRYGEPNTLAVRMKPEDPAAVSLGPVAAAPWAFLQPVLSVSALSRSVSAPIGGVTEVRFRVTNSSPQQVRGTLRLALPVDAWPLLDPRSQSFELPFTLDGKQSREFGFKLTVPVDAKPAEYWVRARAAALGLTAVSELAALRLTARPDQ